LPKEIFFANTAITKKSAPDGNNKKTKSPQRKFEGFLFLRNIYFFIMSDAEVEAVGADAVAAAAVAAGAAGVSFEAASSFL